MEKARDRESMSQDPRVEKFVQSHGGLEDIRRQLGFTKKQISDILWVDPSSWTRWTRGVSRPPAHIYRALEWYLELLRRSPNGSEGPGASSFHMEWEKQKSELLRQIHQLRESLGSEEQEEAHKEMFAQIERKEKLTLSWKLLLILCLILSFFNLVF